MIEGVRPGTIYANMSTIAPTTAVKVANALAAKGVRCLDAPVSGGEVGAVSATLSIMVGGAPVTDGFARQIRADGYRPDASSAVRLTKGLIG